MDKDAREQLRVELEQEAERAAARIRATQPQPCTKFRNATITEWIAKLDEEAHEVVQEAVSLSRLMSDDGEADEDEIETVEDRLALELTDVITVCTSWLHALGYDEELRGAFQRRVNKKNKARGYF